MKTTTVWAAGRDGPGPPRLCLQKPISVGVAASNVIRVRNIEGGSRSTGVYFEGEALSERTLQQHSYDTNSPLPPIPDEPLDDINFVHSTLGDEGPSVKTTRTDLKPFVQQVAKFMEFHHHFLPFEYVDVWVEESKLQDEDARVEFKRGSVSLRHVGHAISRQTELCSIFTMYNLNSFGDHSERYVFGQGKEATVCDTSSRNIPH